MAPLDRNFVTRVALIGVLICIFTTDSTIACSKDFTTCRYDCLDEVVQEHCTSENAGHCAVDGKCCPGFFRTKNSCQICPDVHFMHDVNNCCECLPCSECDDVKNNTIETRCSHTTDTACKIPDDPPPRAPSACPWIESTSTSTSQVPTTQVPTTDTEESTVDTPSDPQGNKSVQPHKGFYTFMVLFILLFGFVVLICCFLCYAHHSGENDQTDGRDKTWKGVASIVAEQICRTCAACRAACQPAIQSATGSQSATPTGTGSQSAATQSGNGSQPATPTGTGSQPATLTGTGSQSAATQTGNGSQSATPTGTGCQPATPTGTGSQSATQTGNGSQPATPTGNGSQPATPTGTGSQPATQTGNGSQPATPTGNGSQPATPTGNGSQPATPTGTGSQPATQTGTGSQSATQTGNGSQLATPTGNGSQSGDDETDERDPLVKKDGPPGEKTSERSDNTCVEIS